MLPATETGLLSEAAALIGIVSAIFAMVSLGGLAVAQSDVDARPPHGWVVSAWISWSVFVVSVCAFAALSTVQ